MWTPATRKNYSRNGLRYQSDVTDEEWRVIEPYLPPAKGIGRPRDWPLREIVNGIFYVMRSGCPWRQLPKDLPPWSTVYRPTARRLQLTRLEVGSRSRFSKLSYSIFAAAHESEIGPSRPWRDVRVESGRR